MLLLRPLLAVVCALASFGCGAPSQKFKIDMPVTVNNAVQVVDLRPVEQRLYRRTYEGSDITAFRFGDDDFVPDRMTILRSRLQERLRDTLRGKTVSITSFQVTMTYTAPPGLPSNLLAALIIGAIEDRKGERLIFGEIAGVIEGQVFRENIMERFPKDKVEEGVQDVLLKTIDAAARNINSLSIP